MNNIVDRLFRWHRHTQWQRDAKRAMERRAKYNTPWTQPHHSSDTQEPANLSDVYLDCMEVARHG